MTKEKRKRRSFWEPDSETLVNWLDEQTDLGTSLQLIIVDAIQRYGNGDVIKAHLNQRELSYQQGVVLPAQPVVRPEVVEKTPEVIQVAPEPMREPERHVPVQEAIPVQATPEPVIEPTPEPVQDVQDEMPAFDIGDAMQRHDEEREQQQPKPQTAQDINGDYDPIAIMMNDVGSSMK